MVHLIQGLKGLDCVKGWNGVQYMTFTNSLPDILFGDVWSRNEFQVQEFLHLDFVLVCNSYISYYFRQKMINENPLNRISRYRNYTCRSFSLAWNSISLQNRSSTQFLVTVNSALLNHPSDLTSFFFAGLPPAWCLEHGGGEVFCKKSP